MSARTANWPRRAAAMGLAGLLALALLAGVARAAAPQLTVTAVSSPTNLAPGEETGGQSYQVTVENTGDAPTDGSPITITDEAPAGLALDPQGASGENELTKSFAGFSCGLAACTYSGVLVPDETIAVKFPLDVPADAPPAVTNVVRVAGGGALDAAVSTPTEISATPAEFGISPGGASTVLSSTQAGAHPDLTTSIAFNTVNTVGALAGAPKDTTDDLPPGFAGDLVDTPTCSAGRFRVGTCPVGSQVGVVALSLSLFGQGTGPTVQPVYNLAHNPGELAKLGFFAANTVPVEGTVALRPGDYGLRTTFYNTNETLVELDSLSLTLWGVPADPIHDPLRWREGGEGLGTFGVASDALPAPFFTNPTSCGGRLEATFTANSWEQPDRSVGAGMPFGPIVGCDRLLMPAAFSGAPTSSSASAPSGLDVELDAHQTYDNAHGLASSTLNRAVVTLPEGMTVNPSAGSGLGACSEAQYAEEAAQPVAGVGCPGVSKLGEVAIVSPAVSGTIAGSVYLAQPYANPFGSLLALYVVARLPERGIVIKVAGQVTADPVSGRLVTTFSNLPPLPFSTFTFRFHSGATAPLVTPPACGSYTVGAVLSPWSAPSQLLSPLVPSFAISSGFDGGACPSGGVPPFAPLLSAGTLNNRAGSYSPVDIRIGRGDGEQEITGFSSRLPAGLTANLTGVPFCSEAQIALARGKTGAQEEAEPSCPVASQIGRTLVGAGVGPVLAWAPGRVYMAGPFEGAPFSIAAITSAKVGPFDLGTVVVHLPLSIDPSTAAVSVGSGAADQIPHIIKGIVVHVRDIRVYIDRPAFTLNPTNCRPMGLAATVIGSGANPVNPADDVPAGVTAPFQAADCQALAFKPSFSVSTSGRTSRANGASLAVKLAFPRVPLGSEANIAQVKVDLPRQLPSRLKTLQRACAAAQFEANPAGCPTASLVGRAKAITPILPVPLEGPAYFVSHGGEAFPSLILVLQGYGVRIDLVGSTFISKQGITSSTFKTVPDQPVSSFQLTLPQGPYSALAALGNPCKSKLTMPTAFLAQNGTSIKQSTKIAVTGCAKTRKKHTSAKKPKKRRGSKG